MGGPQPPPPTPPNSDPDLEHAAPPRADADIQQDRDTIVVPQDLVDELPPEKKVRAAWRRRSRP
ncbi:MAG: hypothetical protein U0802_12825 [Candidatus Binatia bacterium]